MYMCLYIPGIPSAFSFHRAEFGPQSLDVPHTVWNSGDYNVCVCCVVREDKWRRYMREKEVS